MTYPDRMTAVRLHGPTDLRVEEIAHPGPPGPEEVLLRITATAIILLCMMGYVAAQMTAAGKAFSSTLGLEGRTGYVLGVVIGAVVVGTVLIAINHGDAVLRGELETGRVARMARRPDLSSITAANSGSRATSALTEACQ